MFSQFSIQKYPPTVGYFFLAAERAFLSTWIPIRKVINFYCLDSQINSIGHMLVISNHTSLVCLFFTNAGGKSFYGVTHLLICGLKYDHRGNGIQTMRQFPQGKLLCFLKGEFYIYIVCVFFQYCSSSPSYAKYIHHDDVSPDTSIITYPSLQPRLIYTTQSQNLLHPYKNRTE